MPIPTITQVSGTAVYIQGADIDTDRITPSSKIATGQA